MSKVLSLRISEDLCDKLDSLTRITNRSRSFLTSRAIEEYVIRNSWKSQELHQAIAEANQGVFVSGESVDGWLSAWGTEDEMSMPEADIFPK